MKYFFLTFLISCATQVSIAKTNSTCTAINDFLALSKNNPSVLINGKLIRPSIESETDFILKDKKGVLGHIIVEDTEIVKVIEGEGCDKNEILTQPDRVTDLGSKYVIPGLHDLHIHNYGANADIPNSPIFSKDGSPVEHLDFPGLEAINYRMLYSGVTTYLDLNSYNEDTKAFRDYQRSVVDKVVPRPADYIPSTNIYMTGGIFTFKGSHHGGLEWMVGDQKPSTAFLDNDLIVTQKDQAVRKAALKDLLSKHIKKYQPRALKISYDHNPHRPGKPQLNGLRRVVLSDFIDVAREVQPGIDVICHVGIWKDVTDCMEEGASAVTHLPFSQDNDPEYKIPEGVFARMKAANLTVIPTMTVYMEPGLVKSALFDLSVATISCDPQADEDCSCSNKICTKVIETGILNGNEHFFIDPLLKEVTPQKLVDHYFDFAPYNGNPWVQWGVDHNKLGYRQKTFRLLMNSGVKVISGTDTMWEATFFGFSTHRELELMALSNDTLNIPSRPIDNMQILATSTANAHDFLRHYRGRLQKGFKADLVVLNSSPIADIRNTRDIAEVMVNGEMVDRASLLKNHMGVD